MKKNIEKRSDEYCDNMSCKYCRFVDYDNCYLELYNHLKSLEEIENNEELFI